MLETNDRPNRQARMRWLAEQRVAEQSNGSAAGRPTPTPDEMRLALHELRVHQIELELQNEELHRVLEELEVSRSSFVDLYDNAPVGYATVSAEGLVLGANLTLAGLLCVSRDSLVRQPLAHFILSADQDIYYRFRKRLFESQAPRECELRLQRADKTPLWVSLEVTLVRDEAERIVSRIVIIDIRLRKRVEAEKAQLEVRLAHERKLEAVGRLANGMAHYLNNRLCVIIGHAEMALARTEETDPIHQNLGEVLDAAQHSANLVQELLAFSRKQVINPMVLDLNATLTTLRGKLKDLLGTGITLDWQAGEDVKLVRVDPLQLDQILTHLCTNARDAMQGPGTVTIETGTRILDVEECTRQPGFRPAEYVWCSVRDEGRGIDPGLLDKVFDPFCTTKQVGQGLGMGLAVVHGAVMQNDGVIHASSRPGGGSLFTFYLPRIRNSAPRVASRNP